MVNNKENYKFDLGLEGLRTGLLGLNSFKTFVNMIPIKVDSQPNDASINPGKVRYDMF